MSSKLKTDFWGLYGPKQGLILQKFKHHFSCFGESNVSGLNARAKSLQTIKYSVPFYIKHGKSIILVNKLYINVSNLSGSQALFWQKCHENNSSYFL